VAGREVGELAGVAGPEAGAQPFEEELYLRLNPDVRQAVASGGFRSGWDHYERYGRREGRLFRVPVAMPRDRILITAASDAADEKPAAPAAAVDTVKISHSGGVFIVAWVDDVRDRLDSVDVHFSGWSISFDGASLARLRRVDAEAVLGAARHPYGFWGFLYGARRLPAGSCSVVMRLKSGMEINCRVQAEAVEDDDLRSIVLGHLAQAQYFGNPYFESAAAIAPLIGAQMVDFNKMLSRRAVNAPYVERFGRRGRRYKTSMVVCLYGRPEYMFLQNAMFSRLAGMEDYEFIYVCNSPHIAERLLKEARLCALMYGLDMSVIILNANAGFGAANNVAVQYAGSGRVVIMNPDVFPRDAGWARRHLAVLEEMPEARTALFGAPLYYDDGIADACGHVFLR
jgi:hypothetical protein